MITPEGAARYAHRYLLGLDGVPATALSPSVAVITGGGRGIGRMLAETLAGAGAAVGVLARSEDELAETVTLIEREGGTVAAATADVTNAGSVAMALAKFRAELGPIDVLVNNAGILGPVGPIWELDADDWWKTMEVNVRGMLTCTQLVVPEMASRGHGRILNVASQAGVYRWPLVSAYSVSKAAVVKLTENVARETSRLGIKVFSVHPGLLNIGLGEPAILDGASPGSYFAQIRDWVHRELDEGRGGDPTQAMRLMLRLARGDADALSGLHISVHDDLDAIIDQIDVVRANDLYVLRPEGLDLHARADRRDVA